MKITTIQITDDLAAALHKKMVEMTAALHGSCTDLTTSPGGRDILHAVSTIGPKLATRWARFDTLLGASAFTPRMYNFAQTGKANKARWEPRRVTVASRDFLAGDPGVLRKLLSEFGAQEANNYVNIWVWPAPQKGPGVSFVLVRHKDGTEAAFSVIPEKWTQIETSPSGVSLILASLLAPDKQLRKRWIALLGKSAMSSSDELRAEILPLLQQWGLAPPSEDQWRELLQAIFMRHGYLHGIIEAGRHLSTPLMHEAQNLLEKVGRIAADAQENLDRRVHQLEREHSRALKRARADLDKANLSLSGAHARNRLLAKEIAAMQEQARRHPSTAMSTASAAESSNDMSLGVALDQFFG